MHSIGSTLLHLSFLAHQVKALPQITAAKNGIRDWLSPQYTPFQAPLVVPPTKLPKATYTEPINGTVIDFFEIDIRQFTAQTYPLSSGIGPTTYVGYDGMAPGPTLRMTRGREAVRTLWYHDHAIGITAVNAYFGQAGFYILTDNNAPTTLPTGDYDIPLMISAKQFQSNGKLFSPEAERDSLWGDVVTVNGVPWPFQNVEPRKYKFRLLDASVSRSFKLYLVDAARPNTRLPFHVVGGDAGYLSQPVQTTSLVISMAERWEIVIDFALYQGKSLILMNERDFQTNEDYPETHKVMKWVVTGTATSQVGNGPLPATLATLPDPGSRATVDHEFKFERNNGEWRINGVGFEDIPNRILAKPPQGGLEKWRLKNSSGGWSHPIHIHLIDFKVVSRVGGRGAVEPYEAAALKDVVYLGENEEVEVIAKYQPWAGVYMFHCHNLVHEDHDMMAAFNVTSVNLSSYGYPDDATFTDPMAAIWRAKPWNGLPANVAEIESTVLPLFAGLGAYPSTANVEAALADYYTTHPMVDGIPPNVKARSVSALRNHNDFS
ncbi:putative Bilirubin oxidase [Glarea lozoyensis 74030]|uniref:Putative Bilirubin oxidase n=1 Tax=Glarea lozoyensis (strain ATCC 74030 / MF5533) TaxID=1104152 RepID=H0EP52_GLAL7|nr:putative Bilirubin oxidase [Glarea lozoyensis 74030]